MATDFTVSLVNRPGSLVLAADALARAGINIPGACGYVCEGRGLLHVLAENAEKAQRARMALLDAGLEICAERHVVLVSVEDRPGSGAAILRQVADAGVNIDLLYVTTDGRLVLGGENPAAIRKALGR